MAFIIEQKILEELIAGSTFANAGDCREKIYWVYLQHRFPNCEEFWKQFIVPLTSRIEVKDNKERKRIKFREGIHPQLKVIATLHYSLFLNLAYAYNHLINNKISGFEDFYIHLGSVCDLAEEFILKIHINILRWEKKKSEVLESLSREQYLYLAGEWYDKHYPKVYEHYLNKGKLPPNKLPSRVNVLNEYLNSADGWKEYKRHSQLIREYRNVIVHSAQIGRYINSENIPLVPKKEKIQQYRTWDSISQAAQDKRIIESDFINMREQMTSDVTYLENLLNRLWVKVISDMIDRFRISPNINLLTDYDIEVINSDKA